MSTLDVPPPPEQAPPIRAEFDSKCSYCLRQIKVGHLIILIYDTRRYMHWRCYLKDKDFRLRFRPGGTF